MVDPAQAKSLAQAIYDNNIYEPIYARMLVIGSRSGSTEAVLERLSDTFFDDSVVQVDGIIDNVEPTLAAFLTVSVGATLIAVMLPPHRLASTRQKKQLRTIKQLPQVNEPFLNAPSGRQGYSGFIVRYSDEIKFTLL